MYLLLSIVSATILGYLLLRLGPLIGGLFAFGIVLGCMFRGLYLLNDISKRLSKSAPDRHLVKRVDINQG